ncbi:hypothetical protein [Pedobacter immunditicola]|uniref:hypothetical protein n=1 Tax=Pedobacter immunditicola TaxID=3133440 RepID=UPI00309C0A7C
MRYMFSIVKADYLQRTRSYAFLLTLAITIYVAYLFVPAHTANYTTLGVHGYKAAFNAAWVGYLSAIMTTVMLSFYGFLLVNNSIKKDIETEVGLIIATSRITNFQYLLSKHISNYLVLLSITACIFVTSIVMFFIRGGDHPFILGHFVWPFVIFALPALFLVAALAVVAEVFLGKRSILQFILYFFLCGAVMAGINTANKDGKNAIFDPFGLSTMTNSVKNQLNSTYKEDIKEVSFGFIFKKPEPFQRFEWEGLNWKGSFIVSRLLWFCLGLGLVYFSSFFFHRFDFNQTAGKTKKKRLKKEHAVQLPIKSAGINLSLLPPMIADYSILPFIKTELLLLIRKGNKWFWVVNGALWLSTFFAPLSLAHTYLLPVLWFLQVSRWSDIATREKTGRLHYFTYASYRPLFRMLPAQILAGILLAILLALPVLLRYTFLMDYHTVGHILNGAFLVVLSAIFLGMISGGKKLFEILFFLLTYAVLNKIPWTDYLGTMPHDYNYILIIFVINATLAFTSFWIRSYQLRHL